MAASTEAPEWACMPDKGGYTVQPEPTPASIRLDETSNKSDGGNNQKLMLFKRGNDMSHAPIKIGTNQLPKPPIAVGMTKKKIIKNACDVINTLYNW